MALMDLIFNDMVASFTRQSKTVPSEESIHLMLHAHADQLVNPRFIHERDIPGFLEKISVMKEKKHHQLFVEVGTRSLRSQGVPEGIHYSAMDVFCDETGKILAFIADHYQGANYHSYREMYATMALADIQFIVAGGTKHQTDGKNCPIFTLQHLLLTARDESLLPTLTHKAAASTDRMIRLPWFDLAPRYNASTQSFNELQAYIDSVKEKEQTSSAVASTLLSEANFDRHLSGKFQEILNKTGKPIIINNNIECLAMNYAAAAIIFAQGERRSDSALIEICYREQYPFVADIMQHALTRKAASSSCYLRPDALFDCFFSNQPLLSFLSVERIQETKAGGHKKQNASALLYALLMTPSFMSLIQQGYIDPGALFQSITDRTDPKVCKLVARKVELLHSYIKVDLFSKLHALLTDNPGFDASGGVILEVLFIKNITLFFGIDSIIKLYCSGELRNEDLLLIRKDLLLDIGSLSGMTDGQLKSALIAASPTLPTPPASPTSVAAEEVFCSLGESRLSGQGFFSAQPKPEDQVEKPNPRFDLTSC